jgi:hypothetical protein
METTFFAVLTPLLPSYRDDLGLGDAEVGVLSGSFAAGTLLMAAGSRPVTDPAGR